MQNARLLNHEYKRSLHSVYVAEYSKDLKLNDLPPKFQENIARTRERILRLEKYCRVLFRGGAAQEYKIKRVELLASRQHLINLLRTAMGEEVEENSPWAEELKDF